MVIYSRFMLDKFAYISTSFYGFMVGLELTGFSLPDFFTSYNWGTTLQSLTTEDGALKQGNWEEIPAGQILGLYMSYRLNLSWGLENDNTHTPQKLMT